MQPTLASLARLNRQDVSHAHGIVPMTVGTRGRWAPRRSRRLQRDIESLTSLAERDTRPGEEVLVVVRGHIGPLTVLGRWSALLSLLARRVVILTSQRLLVLAPHRLYSRSLVLRDYFETAEIEIISFDRRMDHYPELRLRTPEGELHLELWWAPEAVELHHQLEALRHRSGSKTDSDG